MTATNPQQTMPEDGQRVSQMQLKKLNQDNFARFVELLPFRDWTPERPVAQEMPLQRAQEMAQMSMTPQSGCGVWLIHDQQTLEAVGVITMMPVFHIGCRQLGYWVLPEHHNRGYGSLAVRGIKQICFEQETGISRLQAQVVESNPASIKVLEKAGFEREALLRKSHMDDGSAVDAYLYGLVKE